MSTSRDIMIDLETLSLDTNAAILQIAAVVFERDGNISELLHMHLDVSKQKEREVDFDTAVRWCLKQDDPVKAFSGGISLSAALLELRELVEDDDRVWGNGSHFDITILEDAFKKCQIPIPWQYYNIRDVRTVCDLASLDVRELNFEGEKHNARDAALHQVKYLTNAMKGITYAEG